MIQSNLASFIFGIGKKQNLLAEYFGLHTKCTRHEGVQYAF